MSANVTVCEVDPQVETLAEKFRLRQEKSIAAIVLKIDYDSMTVVLDDEYEDVTIEEIQAELPGHLPRYVILSYVLDHGDGRISYPLCFIFISPAGTKPELQMMYAGSKLGLITKLGMSKVFELRSTEEFTEEWLIEKLKFFR